MSRLRALSARPEHRLVLVVAAALVYLGSWEALHHGFYARGDITDTPIYRFYGQAMRAGFVPYRDFAVEYPPGALPIFVAPTLAGPSYADAFSWLMAGFGVCCLVLVAVSGASTLAIAFVAVSPLLIGEHVSSRYDLWPTALTVAALAAFLRDRHRLGWAALAAGFAAKLFPALLMPLAWSWTLKRRGRAELLRALWVGGAVAAAAFGPF